MDVQGAGIKADRPLLCKMFLYEGIEFFEGRVINCLFPERFRLRKEAVAADEELEDLQGDHRVPFEQRRIVLVQDVFENVLQFLLLGGGEGEPGSERSLEYLLIDDIFPGKGVVEEE